jgi:hypothetical protein
MNPRSSTKGAYPWNPQTDLFLHGLPRVCHKAVIPSHFYSRQIEKKFRDRTGTSFAHYIHPDELPKLAKYYLQRIAGKEVPNNIYNTIIKHKDGSDIPIEIKASVVQYQGRQADFAIVRKIMEDFEKQA